MAKSGWDGVPPLPDIRKLPAMHRGRRRGVCSNSGVVGTVIDRGKAGEIGSLTAVHDLFFFWFFNSRWAPH
jgi:hypothetical protein